MFESTMFESNKKQLENAEKELNALALRQGYLSPTDITNALGYTQTWRSDSDPIEITFSLNGENVNQILRNIYTFTGIDKVIFNDPATIVIWGDGSKTVVKCKEGEEFDKWTGLAMCISKRLLGSEFHRVFKQYCD